MGNNINPVQTIHTDTFGDVKIFPRVGYGEISPLNGRPKYYSYKGTLSLEQESKLASEASAQAGTLMEVLRPAGEDCYTIDEVTQTGLAYDTHCRDYYYLVVPKRYPTVDGGSYSASTATCDLENVAKIRFGYPDSAQGCYDFLATLDPDFNTDYGITRVVNRWHGIDWLSPDYYIVNPK